MDLKNQDSEGSEQRHLQQQQQQHFHVLAVDDSVIDRKLLERLLTVSSYQVTCVESGDKALEYLGLLTENNSTSSCSSSSNTSQQAEGSKVHLIMTDYSMPGMSGYDLLRRVKGSSCKDVPVVVMSSENIPSRINMCLEGGAEEFLLKPVKLSDLSKLQSHLINSPSHSCKEMGRNFVVEDDDNEENNKNEENSSNEMSLSCTNYKRKAMTTPTPIKSTERRPEMKELAVL